MPHNARVQVLTFLRVLTMPAELLQKIMATIQHKTTSDSNSAATNTALAQDVTAGGPMDAAADSADTASTSTSFTTSAADIDVRKKKVVRMAERHSNRTDVSSSIHDILRNVINTIRI